MLPAVSLLDQKRSIYIDVIDLNAFISFLQIYICYLSWRETVGNIYLSIYSISPVSGNEWEEVQSDNGE
jgi:hypothetical protein